MTADSLAVYVSRPALMRHNVTEAVIRPTGASPPWALPIEARRLLLPLLLREGFDVGAPILVAESSDRLGFILRQRIEGSSLGSEP